MFRSIHIVICFAALSGVAVAEPPKENHAPIDPGDELRRLVATRVYQLKLDPGEVASEKRVGVGASQGRLGDTHDMFGRVSFTARVICQNGVTSRQIVMVRVSGDELSGPSALEVNADGELFKVRSNGTVQHVVDGLLETATFTLTDKQLRRMAFSTECHMMTQGKSGKPEIKLDGEGREILEAMSEIAGAFEKATRDLKLDVYDECREARIRGTVNQIKAELSRAREEKREAREREVTKSLSASFEPAPSLVVGQQWTRVVIKNDSDQIIHTLEFDIVEKKTGRRVASSKAKRIAAHGETRKSFRGDPTKKYAMQITTIVLY